MPLKSELGSNSGSTSCVTWEKIVNSDPQFNFEIGHDSTNNAQGFYKRESSSHI